MASCTLVTRNREMHVEGEPELINKALEENREIMREENKHEKIVTVIKVLVPPLATAVCAGLMGLCSMKTENSNHIECGELEDE